MKSRAIVFGNLLVVSLLLTIPTISAVEYRAVEDNIESNLRNQFESLQNNINQIIVLINYYKINLNLLLTIFFRGIILPILLDLVSTIIALSLSEFAPVLSNIFEWIAYSKIDELCYSYIMNMIIEDTGRVFIGVLLPFILIIFNNKVTDYLINALFNDRSFR